MNFKTGLLAICLTALMGSLTVGCGGPCGDLQDTCDACPDDANKGFCQAIVDADDSDACDTAISLYEAAGCK
jgi:hypothetical protein